MKIEDPDLYIGKRIRVSTSDGDVGEYLLFGYGYDFDDNDVEHFEVDLLDEYGRLICLTEEEITAIEIMGEA